MINKIRSLFIKEYYSFIQGHSYLNKNSILKLERILNSSNSEDIINYYEENFSSQIGSGFGNTFAAGRMAFYSLMKILKIGEGDEVILLGSTCSVMPNAVWRTGAKPVFADIDPDTFGSSPITIENSITGNTKMIVAQHSFGIPCKIDEIVEIGKKNKIFVLEDCAITFDSTLDGIKVGNWGDAAIFSCDHSKPINSLIGGFIYTTNIELHNKIKLYKKNIHDLTKDHQKRLFNRFLFERKYYNPSKYGLGRMFEFISNKISFNKNLYTFLEADYTKNSFNETMSYPYPAKLPAFLAQLGLYELKRWKEEKKRRKNIFNNYLNLANKLGLKKYLPFAYFDPRLNIIPLRFVFSHPNSDVIKVKMFNFINVNSFWFTKPIICSNDMKDLGYKIGSCPISEKVGKEIINWPCVIDYSYSNRLLGKLQKVNI